MIVVTGAAGFIGSCMVEFLNQNGHHNLILVDDFTKANKAPNLINKKFIDKVDRSAFFSWLDTNGSNVKFIYHLGARTDTTEFNMDLLNELNLDYTKKVWSYCIRFSIPLVYASSAATYGNGEFGYNDSHELPAQLKPLNPYGISKNEFDIWALKQTQQPSFWAGIKFFNVYGPNEYHKARMASVVFHSYNQIKAAGEVKLFRSHRPDFKDGEQLRDFVYVKDVVNVLYFFYTNHKQSGLFNLGTGHARSFYDLAKAVFTAQGLAPKIDFIDIPADIRDKYQYYTQAEMAKLRQAGYTQPFTSLEDAVTDYVTNYLVPHKCY
jgi:ADP-L-glycero-D-manno-heptose 6-epimerase